MAIPENYQLPILRWQSASPAGVDASYLNITHEITATVIGTGGSITHSGKENYKNGASVTFTLNADSGYTVDTLTDNGATQFISNRYTIPDVDRPHEIIATFRPSPVPPVPPVPSGDSSGNMDNAYRVLFATSGGSFISQATGLSSGDRMTEPPAPMKERYTFGGWYTDEDCTHAWNFADGIPGDMTLYAKWIGGDAPQATMTANVTTKVTTVPVPTPSHTASVTTTVPAVTTAAGAQPTLTQAPTPFFGMLAGLLAAGVLLRRRE